MHTPTHTHVYKRIHIRLHTHMHIYIYIYTCPHTYTHTHIYAHTYKLYICMHASTSETMARQRLRGKPVLTPRGYALLPVRCNPEGDYPSWPAAQLPVHEERRISAEQPQPTAAHHHHDGAPSRPHPLICTGAEPIHPVHCPRQLPALPWPPETKVIFLPFWRVFLVCCFVRSA